MTERHFQSGKTDIMLSSRIIDSFNNKSIHTMPWAPAEMFPRGRGKPPKKPIGTKRAPPHMKKMAPRKSKNNNKKTPISRKL